jgi:histidinol-phosphate aminotransferase
MSTVVAPRVHGGPDAVGVPRWDFSTNANACGPCPCALEAVRQADPRHYPDPSYQELKTRLAERHGVDPQRLVMVASGSEAIFRLTAWVAQTGGRTVHLPPAAFGDYGAAADAWGLARVTEISEAAIAWACDPSSPLGQADDRWRTWLDAGPDRPGVVVLDSAYTPLRLEARDAALDAARDRVWQLWTPNKALGLTGVRGAYLIAPLSAAHEVLSLERLSPSWPLGSQGVAMLQAWTTDAAWSWLDEARATLSAWKLRQLDRMSGLGWECLPSVANFYCARPRGHVLGPDTVHRLRQDDIKLRDATSLGMPGWWRISVQPPEAQDALVQALGRLVPTRLLEVSA